MESGDRGDDGKSDPGAWQQSRALDSKKWLGQSWDGVAVNARPIIADNCRDTITVPGDRGVEGR